MYCMVKNRLAKTVLHLFMHFDLAIEKLYVDRLQYDVNLPSLRANWNTQSCVSRENGVQHAHTSQNALHDWFSKQRGCVNNLSAERACKPKCNLPVQMASNGNYL